MVNLELGCKIHLPFHSGEMGSALDIGPKKIESTLSLKKERAGSGETVKDRVYGTET